MLLTDIVGVASLAKAHGITTLIDTAFATPLFTLRIAPLNDRLSDIDTVAAVIREN